MWNELDLYRPHTTDSAVLFKKADEGKVFQIWASLGPKYEDLRSHLLMTLELPSFASVCEAVQREETRRKVMSVEIKTNSKARAFNVNHKLAGDMQFKGRRSNWKCTYCNGGGHVREKCWILHPELRPKFENRSFRDVRGSLNHSQTHAPRAYHAISTSSNELVNFTNNLVDLTNKFAAYIQRKKGSTESEDQAIGNPIALLRKFAGFLANSECVPQRDISGPSHQEEDW
ncbi:hypothetical protein ACFX2F_046924 [Malus domestica]